MTTRAMTYCMLMVLNRYKCANLLQLLYQSLTTLVAVVSSGMMAASAPLAIAEFCAK